MGNPIDYMSGAALVLEGMKKKNLSFCKLYNFSIIKVQLVTRESACKCMISKNAKIKHNL